MVLIQGDLHHFSRMACAALKKRIDNFWLRRLFPFFWKVNSPEVAIGFKALDAPFRFLTHWCCRAPNHSELTGLLHPLKVCNRDVVAWPQRLLQADASAVSVNSQSVCRLTERLAACVFSFYLDGNS
jgi:hypothetical protein